MTASRYECVMSRSLTVSTFVLLGFFVLLLAVSAGFFAWIGRRTGWPPALVWSGALALGVQALATVGAALFTWLMAPRAVLITEQAVVVDRRLFPLEIPLGEIKAVRLLVPGDMAGGIRTSGAAGIFAQVGRFHSPALGNFRMYLRNEADGVVLDAKERFVLSPRPALGFVMELSAKVRHGQGSGARP